MSQDYYNNTALCVQCYSLALFTPKIFQLTINSGKKGVEGVQQTTKGKEKKKAKWGGGKKVSDSARDRTGDLECVRLT